MKGKTSISIDDDLLKQARELGLNISQITNAALQKIIRGYESIEMQILMLQYEEDRVKNRLELTETEKARRIQSVKEWHHAKRADLERDEVKEVTSVEISYDYNIGSSQTRLSQIKGQLKDLYKQQKDQHKDEEGMRLMRNLNEKIRQFEYNVNNIWVGCQDLLDELNEVGIDFESKKELQVHIKKVKELQLYS